MIAALLLGGGIVLLLSLNVFRMDSEINDGVLYIHFGILFPMIWKRISLADIVDVRSIVYRPLRDAGGWGWRCGRFDKHRTWFYNAKGNQGVLLTMRQGGCYIIGSQCPDVFKDALDKGGIPDGICSER
ncbi:MAG: hypothetical protein KAH38_09500 [Candidatus Hydrogenedentes bacterium]|nr:hypothetical protein [Candidatus Hydrogenedentota bacterium]